jgi:ABC-2 type transport system ATP-binding protein
MTQRVALSAAFLHRPPLYVIDEPLVGLDPASAETFHRMCRAAASSGATVILSSHTLSIVRKFCDRLGILHLGRLAAEMDTEGLTDEELERTFFGITGSRPAEVRDYFSG